MAFLEEQDDDTFDLDDSPFCGGCGEYWENCICDELGDDEEEYWEEDYYDSDPLDDEGPLW